MPYDSVRLPTKIFKRRQWVVVSKVSHRNNLGSVSKWTPSKSSPVLHRVYVGYARDETNTCEKSYMKF